jgi:alanine racemase
MRIAILAAGYADGISRKLSNRGAVLIKGKRCPILGRVTMDMIMVDVSRVLNPRWGDEAVLIGTSGKEEITAQDIATWAETNPYEVLCNISKRVPREKSRD